MKAKKSLGQNFLVDSQISRRIIDSVSPQKSDLIVEIGPGAGALTRLLVRESGFVLAAEIDSRLVGELRRTMPLRNLSIVEADALKANWAELIKGASQSWRDITLSDCEPRVRVVANLPYYISTPIIERLLGLRRMIFDMTLMLQNEVAERIASDPGGREYGYLSVLTQYYCSATKLFEVPPSAFDPVPKVQSAVIRLTVHGKPAIALDDEAKFFWLVRIAFAQRRKTILNNLKAARGAAGFAREIPAALDASGIDPRRRAETLSLGEFGALYDALYDN
jgi:16S rRNA (adenine1518-N6/adenine1519-N6)-dimethyltransferase